MGRETISEIEYFARALKALRIRDAAARLAEQAREAGWTHEEYLAAVLSQEVSARESSGAELRIRAAGFPGRKSLEEFNFDHQPSLKRDTIAHLGTGSFLAEAKNVVLLGPPGTGKTHLRSAWASRPPMRVTASCSQQQRTGSPGSNQLTSWVGCPRNL